MPKSQDRTSLDDVLIPVTRKITQGTNPDPTADVVQFQFVVGGLPSRARPSDTGWIDGFWLTTDTGLLFAGILVGPEGTVTLAPGRWAVWITVKDNPTAPVQAVDVLTIT